MFADNFQGESALHLAIIHGNVQETMELAKDDVLRSTVNQLGFTPLELAHFLEREDCLKFLEDAPIRKIKTLLKDDGLLKELLPEEFQSIFGVTYSPFLKFENYTLFKEVLRNCPLILKKKWLGKENLELGLVYQEPLRRGLTADLVVKWINEQLGYGLFANEEIAEGAFVGEYTGRVRRLFRSHPNPNAYCFHYPTKFWSWKYFAIDSLKEGNAFRFANHSDQATLQPKCLVDRGLLHHVFFAKRKILIGEQLTFDYGEDYWVKRKKIPVSSSI